MAISCGGQVLAGRITVASAPHAWRSTPTCRSGDGASDTARVASRSGTRRAVLRSTVLGGVGLLARPSNAAEQAPYDAFARNYDELNDGSGAKLLGLEDLRRELLAQASGDVLEVGVGTGLNLPLYSPQKLKSITAVDLSEGMLSEARKRAQELPVRDLLSFAQGNVEQLPLEADSFDCVIDTFSLCVFPNPVAALTEMRRVVRPNGRVLLLEHNRSPNSLLGAYQDLTAKPVASMSKGCVYNQDVRALVEKAGLKVVSMTPALGGLIQAVEAVKA